MTFDAPVNTIDRPVLEFAMASLKKKEFDEFQKQLYDTIRLDDVESSIEPAMKYDPVAQIAHVRMALKNSTAAARFEQLGRVYVRDMDNRVEEATLQMYQEFASKLDAAEAHHQLGDQYRLRSRYDEAIGEYRQALQLDPQHKDTLFNIAACLEYQGKLDEALQSYLKAGEQNPADGDVTYRLARVNRKLGNLQLALKYIGQPVTESGYILKAHILQDMGREKEALETYKALLKLNPDNTDAQYEVGRVLAKW